MALKRVQRGWQVFVYDVESKRKTYVGTRAKWTAAKDLERDTIVERKGETTADGAMTVRAYAVEWLDVHHGPGTRRPAPTTRQVNEHALRAFLTDFGDRAVDGGIDRREALRWAKQHGQRAKTVAAMFNDAIDDEASRANPFANRRAKQSAGRRHIHPLTEAEVDTLAAIALERWGADGYGLVARAWVLFAAWVGTRPGETFAVTWADVDLREGLVTVQRVKGRKQTSTIVLPQAASAAISTIPSRGRAEDLVFPTLRGRPMLKGALRFYWDPVRSAFRQTVTAERWLHLLDGQRELALYTLRHFCASIIVARGGTEYDVSDQLGNTPEVARRTYVHSYEQRQRDRLRGLLDQGDVIDLQARRRSS